MFTEEYIALVKEFEETLASAKRMDASLSGCTVPEMLVTLAEQQLQLMRIIAMQAGAEE